MERTVQPQRIGRAASQRESGVNRRAAPTSANLFSTALPKRVAHKRTNSLTSHLNVLNYYLSSLSFSGERRTSNTKRSDQHSTRPMTIRAHPLPLWLAEQVSLPAIPLAPNQGVLLDIDLTGSTPSDDSQRHLVSSNKHIVCTFSL